MDKDLGKKKSARKKKRPGSIKNRDNFMSLIIWPKIMTVKGGSLTVQQ